VLQGPGGLLLLSFALRERDVRCAGRSRDRLPTETDDADMGRLSGALAQRESTGCGAISRAGASTRKSGRRRGTNGAIRDFCDEPRDGTGLIMEHP
jgi:hypothetical protein